MYWRILINGVGDLAGDVRLGVRLHLGRPLLALAVIATLAVGIGGNVVVFSVVRATLIDDIPYPDSSHLVLVSETMSGGRHRGIPPRVFTAIRDSVPTFKAVGGCSYEYAAVRADADAEQAVVGHVTDGFFDTLGVKPALGRVFGEDDFRTAARAVVISADVWRSQFHASGDVVGQAIRIDRDPWTVVGVMPGSFNPRCAGERGISAIWLPMPRAELDEKANAPSGTMAVFGRVSSAVSLDAVKAQVAGVTRSLRGPLAERSSPIGVDLLRDVDAAPLREGLLLLQGVALILLIIATANVSHLLLARTVQRRPEIAVRLALGATRWRVSRQLITETAVLAIVGGLMGVALAWMGLPYLANVAASLLPPQVEVRVTVWELLFGVGAGWAVAVVVGGMPALAATASAISGSSRDYGQAKRHVAAHVMREWLVGTEVVAAVVALVGSGLFMRSFMVVVREPLGFDPKGVLVAEVPQPTALRTKEETVGFQVKVRTAIEARLAGIPLVFGNSMPSTPGATADWKLTAPQLGGKTITCPSALRAVSFEYFDVLRVPIIRGSRFLADRAARSAVITEEFERRYGRGRNLLGYQLTYGTFAPFTIVGVAANVRSSRFRWELLDAVYVPLEQSIASRLSVAVRPAAQEQFASAEALRDAIRSVDPELPVPRVASLNEVFGRPTGSRYFYVLVMTLLGTFSGFLAAIGVVGVVNHVVSSRIRDAAIRLALGGRPAQLVLSMIGNVVAAAVAGILVGLVVAWGAVQALRTNEVFAAQVHGISPHDLWAFLLAGAGLLGIAILATVTASVKLGRVDIWALLKRDV